MSKKLIDRLWESEAASALTNEAARELEICQRLIAALGDALEQVDYARHTDDAVDWHNATEMTEAALRAHREHKWRE